MRFDAPTGQRILHIIRVQLPVISQLVFGAGIALGYSTFIARLIGPAQFGIYSVATTSINLLSWGSLFGMDVIALRIFANHQSDLEKKAVSTNSVGILLCTTLTAWLGTIAIAVLEFTPLDRKVLLLIAATFPILSLMRLLAAAITGLGHTLAGQGPERYMRDGIPLFMVFIAMLAGLPLTVVDLLKINLFGAFLALSCTIAIASYRGLSLPPIKLPSRTQFHSTVLNGMHITLSGGLQLLIQRMDLMGVSILLGIREAGIYAVAIALSDACGLAGISIGLTSGRKLAAHPLGSSKFSAALKEARLHGLFLIVPIILGALAFGPILIRMVYGISYVDAFLPFSILSAAHLVRALAGYPILVLNMTHNEKHAVSWVIIAVGIAAILVYALVPILGLVGAALASVITAVVMNVALMMRIGKLA